MTKNILISAMSAVMLTACGGGGGSSSPTPEPSPPAPVANTAPQISDAVIVDNNGGLVKVGDVLAFSYVYSDAESDAEGASRIEWLLNNEVIASAYATEYIVLANQEGQQLTARITPVALTGEVEGVASNSNALTVAIDGAPVAENIQIQNSQNRFKPGAVLTASYDYSDADNDAEGESTFRWLRNGEAITGATALEYTLVAADEEQKLEFEVTPKAVTGKLQGPVFLSAVIQVDANTAPVITAATIVDVNVGDVRKGDRLNASYTYSDEENNAEGASTFRWFRGKTLIANAASNFYIVVREDEGQEIRYEITPIAESGLAQGDAVISTPITAAVNQAPTVGNVILTDVNGGKVRPGDALTVTYDYDDADGDVEGETVIGWNYHTSQSVGSINSARNKTTYVVSSNYQGNDISVRIFPAAATGEKWGESVGTERVSVSHLPTSTNQQIIDLNGGDIVVGDVLEAQYTFVDADGDLEDVSGAQFSWYRNNRDLVASGSSKTYTVVPADAGQTLKSHISVRSDAGEQGGVYGSPEVQVPALVFEQSGDIKALIAIPFVNSASSSRNGQITYSSSDENIAIVFNGGKTNTAGSVYPIVAGSVTITATIAAEGELPEVSASYDVEIRDSGYSLGGWMSTDKTAITLAGNLAGITLLSTSQASCDVTAPGVCDDYQSQLLEDYTAAPGLTNRTASTLDRPGYYLSRYGDYAAKTVLASQSRFDSSVGAQFVEFNGKLLKLGGGSISAGANNEIWSSDDGRTWVKVATSESSVFTPRFNHQVQEFKGRLWITAGKGDVNGELTDLQDVWSSLDGINWVEEARTAFGQFSNHSMAVANDKLWIAGGDTTDGQQKVYSSMNGINWIEAGSLSFGGNSRYLDLATVPGVDGAADALLAHLSGSVYEFGENKQFNIVASNLGTGGYAKFVYRDDQLFLIDASLGLGRQRTPTGTWTYFPVGDMTRGGSDGVVDFKGSTWVIGNPANGSPKTSQWAQQTRNGVNWTAETDTAAFAPRYKSALVSTGDSLMMVGGIAGSYNTESWESSDGTEWLHKPVTNSLDASNTYSAIMFNDELYASQKAGVFRLGDDGWQSVASFSAMTFNQLVVHNDKLYLIAGDSTGNNVYVSSDGDSWTHTSFIGAPFTVTSDFSAASFANKLWVIAGREGSTPQQKSWSSADGGATWVQAQAPFEARYAQRVVVYRDALWLFGGLSGTADYNDVYRSTDGITWAKQTDNMNVPSRQHAAMAVHNDRLYRIGGLNGKLFNDVWSSDDGIAWQKAFKTTVSFDPTPLVAPVND